MHISHSMYVQCYRKWLICLVFSVWRMLQKQCNAALWKYYTMQDIVKHIVRFYEIDEVMVSYVYHKSTSVSHYSDVIMGAIAYQITSLPIVYTTVYSGADQRKHQSSASLALVRGIHRRPVNSPHKGPVTRKTFPFDDVIMNYRCLCILHFVVPVILPVH